MSVGPQGERGEKGDHGQQGEQGQQGIVGKQGSDHLGGLALVALILVSGFSILAYGIHKADDAAGDARKALCTLYIGDLQRAQETIDYVDKHPDGAPALGLTKSVLLRSVDGLKQQARDVNPGECAVPVKLKELAEEVRK